MSRLQLDDLHVFLGDAHVIQGVSLSLEEGRTLAILGRNGVGKTTLLRAIMGLSGPPRRGAITWNGLALGPLPTWRRAHAGLGYVPQSRRIFASLSVEENLRVAQRPAEGAREAWSFARLYALFPNLYERRHERGSALSGGEQQMLAVARALMGNPRVIMLDEPTEGLAPALVARLLGALQDVKRAGQALLLVEQDFRFAGQLADAVQVMQAGRIVHSTNEVSDLSLAAIAERYLGLTAAPVHAQ